MNAPKSPMVNSGLIAVHDIEMYYEEYGQGPALICLHGGGPGADSRNNFAANIDALAQEHRVLLVDLPQFGRSSKPVIVDEPLTYFARHLRELMRQIGVESAHVIGNSLGGQTAIKLAIDFPDFVESITVIGSNPVARSIFSPVPVEGVKRIMEYYAGEGPTLDKMRNVIETFVFDKDFVTDGVVERRFNASVAPDLLELKKSPAPSRQDLSHELTRVSCPALIVWGLEDRAGPLDVGLQLARAFPQAEMHIFGRTGHWAQVERAEEFNRVVGEFLGRARNKSGAA